MTGAHVAISFTIVTMPSAIGLGLHFGFVTSFFVESLIQCDRLQFKYNVNGNAIARSDEQYKEPL